METMRLSTIFQHMRTDITSDIMHCNCVVCMLWNYRHSRMFVANNTSSLYEPLPDRSTWS